MNPEGTIHAKWKKLAGAFVAAQARSSWIQWGLNDKSWLDAIGHPHNSESLHVTERFRRRDFGHLDVEVTVNDLKMYTRPFTVKFTELLLPDTDIQELVCAENEKDWAHLAAN